MNSIQSSSIARHDSTPVFATTKGEGANRYLPDSNVSEEAPACVQPSDAAQQHLLDWVGTDPMRAEWTAAFLAWIALAPAHSAESGDIALSVWSDFYGIARLDGIESLDQINRKVMKRFSWYLHKRDLGRESIRIRMAVLREILDTLVRLGVMDKISRV